MIMALQGPGALRAIAVNAVVTMAVIMAALLAGVRGQVDAVNGAHPAHGVTVSISGTAYCSAEWLGSALALSCQDGS